MIKMEFLQQAVKNFPEHVLYPYNIFMEKNGFEAICEFSHEIGCNEIYVPRPQYIFKHCIEQEILKRYNGNNARVLTNLSGYSRRYFFDVIKEHR